MNKMIRILLVCLLFVKITAAQHSNELFIDGGFLHIGENGLLHVAGDIHLDQDGNSSTGVLDNDGILELRGNFYVDHSNTEQTDGLATKPGTSQGTVRFRNRGFTNESSHASESQSIIFNATDGLELRAFYNLELYNDNQLLFGTFDNMVQLSGGDLEVKHQLVFGTDTRFRTDDFNSIPNSGSDYDWQIYVSNSDVDAIVGNSTTPGAMTRYVEGKLARQINGSGAYYFPVGLEPGFAGADGMASFELQVSAATSQSVVGFVNTGETALSVPQIYCDIGDYPDAAAGSQPWSACIGGPDGLYDFVHLNLDMSHEWVVENSGTDFTYNIEMFPGPGLDATVPSMGSSCGGDPFHLRFMAKDGVLMDGGSTAEVIDPPTPFNTTHGFPTGFKICPPDTKEEGNQLTGITNFSHFRIHGAAFTETLLPVELVNLKAQPVDNRHIEISWFTLAETNNDGFELQRSTDAINFEAIAWVNGHGNSTDLNGYVYNDLNVDKGVHYYYRLKQLDFDGTYEFSPIVQAALSASQERHFGIYPNPSPGGLFTVEMKNFENDLAELMILDAFGREVYSRALTLEEGINQWDIVADRMVPGSYIVNIYSAKGLLFSEKLIVLTK